MIGRVSPMFAKGGLPIIANYYTSNQSIVVPAGYTKMRATVFSSGADGAIIDNGDGSYTSYGGGGGACSQSIIDITPGETISVYVQVFGGGDCGIFRTYPNYLIKARNASGSFGGQASDGVGDMKFSGGNGAIDSYEIVNVAGGGAAGTQGNGGSASYTTPGIRGAGTSFLIDGVTIVNGPGGGSSTPTGVGGGVSAGGNGPTIRQAIVIEFGVDTL